MVSSYQQYHSQYTLNINDVSYIRNISNIDKYLILDLNQLMQLCFCKNDEQVSDYQPGLIRVIKIFS